MTFDIDAATVAASALNQKLQPFCGRPVDINDPNWMEKLRQSHPLDEAGVRHEAESLLLSLLAAYASGTTAQRAAIRELFRTNRAFGLTTGVRQSPDTAQGFRQHVLHASVLGEIEDPRDIMVSLHDHCAAATAAGVAIEPILAEVAALSEPVVRRILSRTR